MLQKDENASLPQLVTIKEAAKALSVSEDAIRDYCANGRLREYRLPSRRDDGKPENKTKRGAIRIDVDSINELIGIIKPKRKLVLTTWDHRALAGTKLRQKRANDRRVGGRKQEPC